MKHIIENTTDITENTKQTIFLTCVFAVLILCLTSAPFVRADQTLANIATGTSPVAVAVNPITNRTYVANQIGNTVTVINGADASTTTINVGNAPQAIAVNTETNRIYVVNFDSNNVTVINGADNTTTNFVTSDLTIKVAVNPATNKIYVAGQVLAQVDGVISQNRLFVETSNPPRDIVFNQQTDQVFVPIPDGNTVTILTPTLNVAAPLNTTVVPSGFTNNTTMSRTPTFTLTANTTNTLAPRNIYYQFDTKQGEWRRAVTTGSTATTLTATAAAPFLYNGIHTIYFFATDGTDSSSINPSRVENEAAKMSKTAFDSGRLAPEASSITGQIGSYHFLVAAPLAPTAAQVTISGQAMSSTGRGIRNVFIRLTDANGAVRFATTTTFGYYRFANVNAGETYIITAKGKRFEFSQPTQVLNIGEDTYDINFVANPK